MGLRRDVILDYVDDGFSWLCGINPMDVDTSTFHSSEVCHLSLGELVDGNFQLSNHFVVGELPCEVKCQIAILQAVADEVFCLDTVVE